ncbi:hypothetical protein ANOM_002495 [Aspergillus nomiae NRRL 13137]|uniref:Glycan binding protein Y3-like domain-containing protein n=1 Tax=Aspergillus nomiae NRRL (strain ATCC 15546 / NRRL 13137 / CBS 260.88 / M93) TaxID=1509407 RepID=A0A0L1J995_ASPN3|nr:uncharacterized protein ANOM_002495 [Aspergillus nomiae NRRL 13137]KNG88302.1 hypothetical protein ANOM_002495 [Aspergillus nomiae NRRL 13137]
MRFQALPVLATVLAIPSLVFGAPNCYESGFDIWKTEGARSAAAHGIDKYCNNLAPSTWTPRTERQQCLEVDASPKNVNLWIMNDASHDLNLSIDRCKKIFKKIVDSCSRGGHDETNDGWWAVAYPDDTCLR